jgi:hypothetical protein
MYSFIYVWYAQCGMHSVVCAVWYAQCDMRSVVCAVWAFTAWTSHTPRGDGSILLRSKYLQRYTSTKIKFFGGFSEFLCLW